MAFEIASTNLVVELGIIMALGPRPAVHRWRVRSGPLMIMLVVLLFRNWAAVARDIFDGLLIAGALVAWVPDSFWRSLFLDHHGALSTIWGPVVGPLVAVISFVCSIGNVPLAAVLWNGGISFGGVLSFIFADLIILPILNIYRKYYGLKMAVFIAATFYAAMVVAGLVVDHEHGHASMAHGA
jgi:uncharacterized protein